MTSEHTNLPELPSAAEINILLRSSGELGPAETTALDHLLAEDTQLAEYAHFIDNDLSAAASCPRDFAAEAIRIATATSAPRDFAAAAIATVASTSSERQVVPFPTWRKYAYSAAAAACIYLSIHFYISDSPPASNQQVAMIRITAQISNDLSDLDSQISASNRRIKDGRFRRSTTQL